MQMIYGMYDAQTTAIIVHNLNTNQCIENPKPSVHEKSDVVEKYVNMRHRSAYNSTQHSRTLEGVSVTTSFFF